MNNVFHIDSLSALTFIGQRPDADKSVTVDYLLYINHS